MINGMNGIGTGFSTSIPKYSVTEVIKNLQRKLDHKEYTEMTPSYKGFKGQIVKMEDKMYLSKGCYAIVDDNTIEITELPIGKWTDDYKKFLDGENCFKDYVRMVIKFNSTVHFPGETNSIFVKAVHTWYAMRIVKPCNNERLSCSDIYYMG